MKNFKQEDNLLYIISEAISEGVVIVNAQQSIVSVNNSLLSMFGYSEEGLINQNPSVLIPQNIHKQHKEYVEEFTNYENKRQMGHGRDLNGIHKDGSQIPVEVGLNPFIFNNEKYVMAIVVNITLRREQENKILDLNLKL